MVTLYGERSRGVLYAPGGLMDQTPQYVEAMQILDGAFAKLRRIEEQRRERSPSRGIGGTPGLPSRRRSARRR